MQSASCPVLATDLLRHFHPELWKAGVVSRYQQAVLQVTGRLTHGFQYGTCLGRNWRLAHDFRTGRAAVPQRERGWLSRSIQTVSETLMHLRSTIWILNAGRASTPFSLEIRCFNLWFCRICLNSNCMTCLIIYCVHHINPTHLRWIPEGKRIHHGSCSAQEV